MTLAQQKLIYLVAFIILQAEVLYLILQEVAILISNMENLELAADYIVSLGCENLIITLGRRGALLKTKEKQILIPTKQFIMRDATGAGDAFIGAVIAQLLKDNKKDIEEIVKVANLVGGITTTKIGALESIPEWNEVEQYINNMK